MADELERLIEHLRGLTRIESVFVDYVTEVMEAGSGTPEDPFYEEGPFRQYRRTGEVIISIEGRI